MNWSFLLTWRSLPSLRVSWCLTMHQQVAAGLHPFTSTLQIVSTMHMCSNYLHRINLISFTLSVASLFLSLSCTTCFLLNINVHVGLVTVALKMRRATQSCNNLFIKNQHSVSRIWQTLHLSGNRKKKLGRGLEHLSMLIKKHFAHFSSSFWNDNKQPTLLTRLHGWRSSEKVLLVVPRSAVGTSIALSIPVSNMARWQACKHASSLWTCHQLSCSFTRLICMEQCRHTWQ